MANDMLTVSSRPRNLVSSIAQFIRTILQHHCDHLNESCIDYDHGLATLVGLSFTAILAEGSQIRSSRSYFATFMRYRHFTQHVDHLEAFSYAIAEMISRAIYSFRALGHPRYYEDFLAVLVNILKSSPMAGSEEEKEIKEIMKILLTSS